MLSATQRYGRIEPLSKEVINRIAAGEVVQRPSAALKELLENSLDAGASRIQILCQDGGLGLLQITDDGEGIHKDDLPMLCERFATSKLRTFEDLGSVMSFGFRGEALASISHVSRLSVTTMRGSDAHAWGATFRDGAMISGPDVVAGNRGTTIRVEDMFYNAPVRRATLSKPSEEYSRILDLVQKYSLCFPHVALSCRSLSASSVGINGATGSVKFDFSTQKKSTTLSNLKSIYGTSLVSHLLPIRETITALSAASSASPTEEEHLTETSLGDTAKAASAASISIQGFVSDATLANKKAMFLLFVNHRLVDSSALRRCAEQVYASVLSGGAKFFVVVLLDVPASRVDVNIHPTKHEVMLLDEDIILRAFADCTKKAIAQSNVARQLHVGQINHEILNLKPVANSSTNVNTLGHKGVVVAPCTVTRVEEQRGEMLKYVVPVDRFALVAKETGRALINVDDASNGSSCKDSSAAEGELVHADVVTADSSRVTPVAEASVACVAIAEDAEGYVVPASCSSLTQEMQSDASSSACTLLAPPDAEVDDSDVDDLQREFKRARKEYAVPQPAEPVIAKRCEPSHSVSSSSTAPLHVHHDSCCTVSQEEPDSTKGDYSSGKAPVAPCESREAASSGGTNDPHVQLTSVETMTSLFTSQSPDDVRAVFAKLVFVGILNQDLFFAQSGTTLFAVDTARLAEAVAFQRVFLMFGKHSHVAFVDGTAPRVSALLRFAWKHDISDEDKRVLLAEALRPPLSCNDDTTGAEKLIQSRLATLRKWRSMLDDYFCISLQKTAATSDDLSRSLRFDLFLDKMPLLLGDAWPLPHRAVPLLLWNIAGVLQRSHENEEQCLVQIAHLLSKGLFGCGVGLAAATSRRQGSAAALVCISSNTCGPVYDAVRFGLVPLCSNNAKFYPSMDLFTNHVLRTVVTVEALYKVFERC